MIWIVRFEYGRAGIAGALNFRRETFRNPFRQRWGVQYLNLRKPKTFSVPRPFPGCNGWQCSMERLRNGEPYIYAENRGEFPAVFGTVNLLAWSLWSLVRIFWSVLRPILHAVRIWSGWIVGLSGFARVRLFLTGWLVWIDLTGWINRIGLLGLLELLARSDRARLWRGGLGADWGLNARGEGLGAVRGADQSGGHGEYGGSCNNQLIHLKLLLRPGLRSRSALLLRPVQDARVRFGKCKER